MTPPLPARCFAELLGTYLLIFFGCGAVHAAVLLGAQSGLWQVAIVWGVAIFVTVYALGGISGAHINPAVTLSLAVWGRFAWRDVVPYVVSQVGGAMLAAATLVVLFGPALADVEQRIGAPRGTPGSVVTAMCYGEYFPSPGRLLPLFEKEESRNPQVFGSLHGGHWERYDEGRAFFAEVLGTAILALAVFALTHPGNASAGLAPVYIGLTVAILISVIAPLTQACFNPARDFGPRLVAYLAGWGEVAIPGPNGRGFWTVYILAPCLGAVLGGGLFDLGLRRFLPPAGGDPK